MPDFSDRYKKALEYTEISPDFKERTAKLMIQLRDEGSTSANPDEENSVSIVSSDDKAVSHGRMNRIRIISAMAAAAACLTVGVALNRAGMFDRDNEPAAVMSESIVTETTDSTEAIVETTAENVYTASAVGTILHGGERDEITESEAAYPSDTKEEPNGESGISETQQAILTEAEPTALTEYTTVLSISETLPETEEQIAAPAAASFIEETDSGAGSPESVITEEISDDKGAYETASSETVLELMPFSEEVEAVPEIDSSEDHECDGEEIVEDEAVEAAPPEIARVSLFSPRSAVGEFPPQSSNVLITPSFEDNVSEDGAVVNYQPRSISSENELNELNSELFSCSDDDSADVTDEAPTHSRYIIDYTGERGNAMRIYIGFRYICFAYEGAFYTYELTEEEYKSLDRSLFGLVS